ncbi:MAG: transketolase C-terminal domain-containing protein [Rhodospirillales bacterium]|jgi:pyruvate dehydrogenase E1 component beta subunit|nr:alpha-ketoacid dehydrogenase subunit beta [Rhodospirillaceae bacterium]MDP6428695.1 transketolase C-terminal domain-containing protein [Rhodospirillales bacterium]MDP6643159.1 transketolase C-terminal domain-containing protein [Rhodospirillales bacterium]MDP6840098.1 transketolase C-terminal domain-containing protein [Rhodospirillales bacterium]
MAKQRLTNAVNDTLAEEMRRDPKIILFGEDVEVSMSGETIGLIDEFGRSRIRNTPICEATLTGMAVGAAASGYRVILHMMMANFVYTGFDAIANQMAKLRLMTGGQITLPITIMAGYGGGRSIAAQHSDTPYPLLMNLGGLNVAVPSNAGDAKGLLKTAIRSDDPAFFLVPGGRGGEIGEVPDGDYQIPFGAASVRAEGDAATIVAIGAMVRHAIEAAGELAEAGTNCEVIDCRTLVPLDEDAIIKSVAKTGRLVVVDEARDRCSAASYISALVADKGFSHLKAPIRRLTVPDTAMPYAPDAEAELLPNPERIVAAVGDLVGP